MVLSLFYSALRAAESVGQKERGLGGSLPAGRQGIFARLRFGNLHAAVFQ